jgi:anti-sigma-K factor RskA
VSADVHALAGAYVLDALPPDEARAFEDHLTHCQACRDEVAELQHTATRLGLAAQQDPPPALRERVLQAARFTPQVPPRASGRQHAPRRAARLVAAAVIVLVAGAGGFGIAQWSDQWSDQRGDQPRGSAVTAVVSAPDATVASARLEGGGTLTAIVSERLGQAVVLTERLPEPPAGRTYQLWLVGGDDRPRAAGLLAPRQSTDGDTRPIVVRQVRPGDRIAITHEPAGGSERPTMQPLAVV